MRWTLFHEAAVKGHLEICQTIMWSLEISNFTDFHPTVNYVAHFAHKVYIQGGEETPSTMVTYLKLLW